MALSNRYYHFSNRSQKALCGVAYCVLIVINILPLQTSAQVIVELEVNSGTSTTTCTDSMSAADNHWSVSMNPSNWFTYPSAGGCFNNTPNIQYQDTFHCSSNYPTQFEVCFQAFEDDGSSCVIGTSCLSDTCDSFSVPPPGQNASYALQIANCCGNPSWGSVNFTISAAGSFLENNFTYIESACDSFYWPPADSTFYVSTTHSETFTNVYGCDSVETLVLEVSYSNGFTSEITACDSFTWLVNGNTYNTSGIFIDTLINSNGCDSVATLDLTIITSDTHHLMQTSCNHYYWPLTGDTLFSSGIYYDTLSNAVGCDSVIILDLSILPSSYTTLSQTACDSFYWSTTGLTYYSSGVYSDTLVNTVGCDSVLTLNLSVNPSYNSTTEISACDSFFWPISGITYFSSGTYADTNTNAFGCDSIVILELYLEETYYETQTVVACKPYTWPINGTTYTSGGTYVESFSTPLGCDSVHQLQLTVDLVEVNVELSSSGNGLICTTSDVSYQWLKCIQSQPTNLLNGETNALLEPSFSGFFAVEVTGEQCIDTSKCYYLDALGHPEITSEHVDLYPNPTEGSITIDFDQFSSGTITILDLNGSMVLKKSFTDARSMNFILDIPSGMYILNIISNHSEHTYLPIIKL